MVLPGSTQAAHTHTHTQFLDLTLLLPVINATPPQICEWTEPRVVAPPPLFLPPLSHVLLFASSFILPLPPVGRLGAEREVC